MALKRKDELIKWIDDFDKREGLAEVASDIAINLAVNQLDKRLFDRLPEWAQEAINDVIDAVLDSDGNLKTSGDPGEGPKDPDPDK